MKFPDVGIFRQRKILTRCASGFFRIAGARTDFLFAGRPRPERVRIFFAGRARTERVRIFFWRRAPKSMRAAYGFFTEPGTFERGFPRAGPGKARTDFFFTGRPREERVRIFFSRAGLGRSAYGFFFGRRAEKSILAAYGFFTGPENPYAPRMDFSFEKNPDAPK